MAADSREVEAEESQHQRKECQQQHPKHEQFAHRVTNIDGPTQAIALGDNHIRIIGVVVDHAAQSVLVVITEEGAIVLPICGRGTVRPASPRRQEKDEKGSGQKAADHQAHELKHAHRCCSFHIGQS